MSRKALGSQRHCGNGNSEKLLLLTGKHSDRNPKPHPQTPSTMVKNDAKIMLSKKTSSVIWFLKKLRGSLNTSFQS